MARIHAETGNWKKTRSLVLERNALQTRSIASAKRLESELRQRLQLLNSEQLALLAEGSSDDRLAMAWLAVLKRIQLTEELTRDLLRDKLEGDLAIHLMNTVSVARANKMKNAARDRKEKRASHNKVAFAAGKHCAGPSEVDANAFCTICHRDVAWTAFKGQKCISRSRQEWRLALQQVDQLEQQDEERWTAFTARIRECRQ